ncbi:MAG: winged helix-turn-helix transcriptional regulator [Haloarculaceae archaeon]
MSDAETDPLAVWCSGEEWCPITATASVLAKKWHPVIVHRLFDGPLGFNDLKTEVDGISSKVLSDSLDDLGEKGIVDRTVVSEQPFRVKYSLTARGHDLRPVIESMAVWGSKHLVEPSQ